MRYPDFASNGWLGDVAAGPARSTLGGSLHRAVLNPARARFADEERSAAVCEFPRVAPRVEASAGDNRHVYAAVYGADPEARHGMFDALGRIDVARGDVEVVTLGPGQYPSEPVFVRRPTGAGPDDGWLLTLVYDGTRHESGVAVLETRDLGRGPVALAWLDHHIPFTFHGNFAPAR